jgi:hypothetical protein
VLPADDLGLEEGSLINVTVKSRFQLTKHARSLKDGGKWKGLVAHYLIVAESIEAEETQNTVKHNR